MEFAIGASAMVLAGSIAWYPHFIHLLIPMFASAGFIALRGWRNERGLLSATIAMALVYAVIAPLVIAQLDVRTVASWAGSAAWWPLLQVFSLPALTVGWWTVAATRSLRRTRTVTVAVQSRDTSSRAALPAATHA